MVLLDIPTYATDASALTHISATDVPAVTALLGEVTILRSEANVILNDASFNDARFDVSYNTVVLPKLLSIVVKKAQAHDSVRHALLDLLSITDPLNLPSAKTSIKTILSDSASLDMYLDELTTKLASKRPANYAAFSVLADASANAAINTDSSTEVMDYYAHIMRIKNKIDDTILCFTNDLSLNSVPLLDLTKKLDISLIITQVETAIRTFLATGTTNDERITLLTTIENLSASVKSKFMDVFQNTFDMMGIYSVIDKIVAKITGYGSLANQAQKDSATSYLTAARPKLVELRGLITILSNLAQSTDIEVVFEKLKAVTDKLVEIKPIFDGAKVISDTTVPTIDLQARSLEGGVINLSWTTRLFSQNRNSVLSLSVTDTTIGVLPMNSIRKIPITAYETKEDGTALTDNSGNVVLKTSFEVTGLTLGTNYLLILTIDKTVSNHIKMKSRTVPQKPTIMFVPRDQGAAFKILNAGSKVSSWDGHSELTGVEVCVADGEMMHCVHISLEELDIEQDFYTSTITIPGVSIGFMNDKPYEIALRLQNDIGYSEISSTVVGIPKDTPNKVERPLAMSEITYLSYIGDTSVVPTGAIKVFYKRPDDYQNLNKKNINGVNVGLLKITSVTIVREKMRKVLVEELDASNVEIMVWKGEWETDTDVSAVSLTKQLPDKDEDDLTLGSVVINGTTYDYTHVDANVDIGGVYQYMVYFSNINGVGEPSLTTNMVSSMKYATAPTVSGLYGNKKVKVTLNSYGNLNGGTSPNSNKFHFETKDDTYPAVSGVFDFDYVESTGSGPTLVMNPNFNTFVFDNSSNGVIFKVKVSTVTIDSFAPSFMSLARKTFISPHVELSGLTFTSPNAPAAVAVYAIDSNYQPITLNDAPAVSVVFTPWDNSGNNIHKFGGLQNQVGFNPVNHVRYLSYTNSLLNQSIAPIYSQPFSAITSTTKYNFIVPSPLNTNPSHYVRMSVLNIATGEWITSLDSTPPQSGSSRAFISAPTSISTERHATDPSSITITFPSNPTVSGTIGGAVTNDVKYLVKVVSLENTSVVDFSANVAWAPTKVSVPVNGLTPGKAYLAYVIPYTLYSANDLGSPTKLFNNVKLRYYSQTLTFVAAAAASPVRNFKVIPQNASFLVEFDAPSSLNGSKLSRYDVYGILQIENDPSATTLYPAFPEKQKAIASVISPEVTSITRVFKSRVNGVDGDLATNGVNIVNNDKKYSISMAFVGEVGGKTYGTGAVFDDTDSQGNTLTIYYSNNVATEYITGNASTPETDQIAYAAMNAPTGLTTTSDSTSITLSFIKDTTAEEVVVMFNGEVVFNSDTYSALNRSSDGFLDASDNNVRKITYDNLSKPWGVDIPATVPASYTGVTTSTKYTMSSDSGLFNMQQENISSPTLGNLSQALSTFFTVTTEGGNTKYNLQLPVSSGESQAIRVYYATRVGNLLVFSDPATANASAAAPPSRVLQDKATYSVAPNQLTVNWLAPVNLGGAGQVAYTGATANSPVKYKLNLYTYTNYNANPKVTLQTVSNIENTSYTFAGLMNYNTSTPGTTSYFVEIIAYFNQQGDVTKPANSTVTLINRGTGVADAFRLAVAPLSPTLTADVNDISGNNVVLSYVIPTNNNYPISQLDVYESSAPTVVVKTVTGGLVNGATIPITITKTDLPSLLNGRSMTFIVKSTPSYNYAQNYPDMSVTVTPRKRITSSQVTVTNPTADRTAYQVQVQTQGTSITGYVALGKTAAGTIIVVQGSVQAGTFIPSMGGIANANDAAGQTATASVVFSTQVNDVALFIATQDGIVSKPFPTNSTAFGLTAV
jgi:hypothetical protein